MTEPKSPDTAHTQPPARHLSEHHNSHAPHRSHSSHSSRATPSSSPLINPLIHQSNNPSAALPRTRNGKVARLPCAVRDMINRMLRNNIPHSDIVAALDEHQFKVTERNISNWKTRGGYHDWCIEQDRALETRLLQDNLLEHLRKTDASQLAEVGLQLAATQLSQFFLKPETRQQLTAEPEKLARTIGILCRLARQIHILQKHRDQSAKELGPEHNPERLKRDTEEILENTRWSYSAHIPDNAPIEPEVPHRNFLPKSGYPAEPRQHEPPPSDDPVVRRNFQELCNIIAARNEQKIAEAARPYTITPETSPSPAPPSPDDPTPSLDQSEPDGDPDQP